MDQSLEIFPINSNPLGVPYGEWSIKWWQWIASIPVHRNPAFDQSGELINHTQPVQDVTFLCQTIEGVEKIPRRLGNIPANKFIFMPIINWISIQGLDGDTDSELAAIAKEKMDIIDKLELWINDFNYSEGLIGNRVCTSFFEVSLPQDNIFRMEKGKKRCISDGYWVFFRYLSDRFSITTKSACSSGKTQIAVEYDLGTIQSSFYSNQKQKMVKPI
jgi:hypothetical protein